MKHPPTDLARRLLDVSEEVLRGDPPPRLEDVARMVGASRATLYYYFAGRDDLLAFLLTAHAEEGARVVQAALDPDSRPEQRLRAMLIAMAGYLGRRPGVCVGLLGALGATGRMSEVLQANDIWIAGPLRELIIEAGAAGASTVRDAGTAADAILGALLLAVLGRSATGADPADPEFGGSLVEQVLHGVLIS